MHIRQTLVGAVFAAAIGALIVPAFAQDQGGAGSSPDQGVNMGRTDHGMMGRGMMHGGMMRGGMMSGGCGGMMQSMNGGGGRPNSQWQLHRPGNATPD
jgi:hypothetical protein